MEVPMETCRINIQQQSSEMQRKASELTLCCEFIQSSLEQFRAAREVYNDKREAIEIENPRFAIEFELEILRNMRQALANQVNELVSIKTKIELKLCEILDFSQTSRQHLLECLESYQTNHKFSQRSSKFTHILQEIMQCVTLLVSFLSQISSYIIAKMLHYEYAFMDIFHSICHVIYDSSLGLNKTHLDETDVLLSITSYKTNVPCLLAQIQELEWTMHQQFSLVVDCQPTLVVGVARPRPVSLRYFDLGAGTYQNALSRSFTIKVYLVREHTATEIRKNNAIPEKISSVTRNQGLEKRQSRDCDPDLGLIFLDGKGDCKGHHHKQQLEKHSPLRKRRSSLNEDPVINAPGYPVEYLEGEWSEKRNCYCFDRQLIVKDKCYRVSRKSDGITGTSEKYALLFVMETFFKNEIRKVWTLSLPFCVTTNSSQYEKAWGTMAWNEVVADHEGKLDTEVCDQAPWHKIKGMLNGTFQCLVGDTLSKRHMDYLQQKVEQMICLEGTKITGQTEITKTNLFGSCKSKSISPWSWFFACISVIQMTSNFHDIWKAGDIAGFISFEDACIQLSEGLANKTAKRGSFMIRFSDIRPGGLTFVFVSSYKEQFVVTKWVPLEIHQKKSMKDCTEAVIKHLSAKESYDGPDAFLSLYPSNKDKKFVFRKFYEWTARHSGGWDGWGRSIS